VNCFTIASYNIHRCVGLDGRCDPGRTVRVIQELGAKIIGLQEVDSFTESEACQLNRLASGTGLTIIPGPTIYREDGHYGNALLVDGHVTDIKHIDLSVPGREPRGAIDSHLNIDGLSVRVVVTHLGLNRRERRYQVRSLMHHITPKAGDLVILLGDINEWIPLGYPVRSLHRCLGKSPARRTFPSLSPLLPLDRIWVRPREAMAAISAHASPLAWIASDHLPLKAEISRPSMPDGRSHARPARIA
jgi:prepilin-type processing-associated H-X9-DG protein